MSWCPKPLLFALLIASITKVNLHSTLCGNELGKIHYLKSFQGREVTASQVEDVGLQAILEMMNSLNTPLISGPCGNVSTII